MWICRALSRPCSALPALVARHYQAHLPHRERLLVVNRAVHGGVRDQPLALPPGLVDKCEVGEQVGSTFSAGTLRQVSTSRPSAVTRVPTLTGPWPGTSQPFRSVSYRDVLRLVGTTEMRSMGRNPAVPPGPPAMSTTAIGPSSKRNVGTAAPPYLRGLTPGTVP